MPGSVQTDSLGNYSQIGFVADTTYLVTPAKTGFTFTPSALAFTGSSSNLNFSGSGAPFSVSGRITDVNGTGSSGATLTFLLLTGTGSAPAPVQTDSQGNYSQSIFETCSSYLVSPSKPGYAFTPVSRTFSDGSAPLNFTISSPPLTVSGRIADGSGNALPGLTLTFTPVSGAATPPGPVQTDSQGNWQQSGFIAGQTWRVTPSKPGDTFAPPSTTFSTSMPGLVFTAYPAISVSGQVFNINEAAISGAMLTFAPGNGSLTPPTPVQTDSAGHWSQVGFAGGAFYTVTPSLAGVTFSPVSAGFVAGASPVNLGFIATFGASGLVTASQGNGYPNVPITFSGGTNTPGQVVTNSSGIWSQSGFLLGTSYKATPVASLCAINPPYQNFSGPSATLNFSIPVCGR